MTALDLAAGGSAHREGAAVPSTGTGTGSPAATTLPFPPNVRYATDPDTSFVAASLNRNTLRARVLDVLERHPNGLTDHELTLAVGEPPWKKPSVGKRRQEVGAVDTGVRRSSPDGMPCVVWRLA